MDRKIRVPLKLNTVVHLGKSYPLFLYFPLFIIGFRMEKNCFENNLWKYRKIAGLKQKEVAHFLDIKNISQISRWEKGERCPSLKNAFKLSAIYSRPIEDLFPGLYETIKRDIKRKKTENEKN